MNRTASAIWSGDLKQGHGALATHSGVLKETPYSFHTRFEQGAGTNPEELIAAAHAGCFTMALAAALSGAGLPPKRLATQASVTLDQVGGNWTISAVHLRTEAWVPGATAEQFNSIANDAKNNCPVSRLLKASITLNATLEHST